MCAIAGTINFPNLSFETLKKALYHRGPDTQTSYNYKNLELVHTRLSIQDVAHGQQPFHYENYTIIFNGEIYNHLELRKEYLQDFDFKTASDTETLLYLFVKFRENMFGYLDGMFAFCILDKEKNQFFLARDRAGKKPLYFYKDKGKFAFASELNALKSICELKINETAIASYLRCGFFYKEYTPYDNVFTLDAGTFCTVDLNALQIEQKKYFDILDFYKQPLECSFEEALESVDKILHKSIRDRLLSSDLEVGAFLSGGIDSSLVVAIASEYKKNLKTYTVKFSDGYDESHLAKLTAKKYNTDHTELSISMNLKYDIEKILLNYGQPFMDSSAIPSYYVSKEAKKHVTVILNGDGADEIFGGYRRYVPSANGLIDIASKFSFLTKILPKPHNKKSLYNYAYRLLSMAGKNGLDFYLSSTVDIFEDEYSFKENVINNQMEEFINNTHLDPLSKMLYLDFNILLFSDLLVKMDIATMSNSLEGRSPFLSKYILEFVSTVFLNIFL